MKHISFYSPKGGQGCTTTAALFALGQTNCVLVDAAPVADMPAVLGISEPVDWKTTTGCAHQVTDQLRLVRGPLDLWGWDIDTAVYDCGPHYPAHGKAIMVVRPCYVALRHAARYDRQPDGIIVISEPGRSLDAHDVGTALGAPVVANLHYDPKIARAVDAGLLVSRRPAIGLHLDEVLA